MTVKDQRPRVRLWSKDQHPYTHPGTDIGYVNPSSPGMTNIEEALDYLFAIVRPNAQPAVANVAALPGAGNTIGDARVVLDDGDGKQAGYIWEQREGEGSPSWHKTLDVDWSTDSILAKFVDVTLPLYVYKSGLSDLDASGSVITGTYAGQSVYGGDQASQNLTLNANSGDGVGAQTGFVQIDSQFRPVTDDLYSLSTATERWKNAYFSTLVRVGTTSIGPASITDSSGSISFGDETLTTTGNINGATVTGTTLVADDTSNTMTLVPGSITDTTGQVSFGASNLLTTGDLGARVTTLTDSGSTLILTPLVAGPNRSTLISSTGALDFGANTLITTGTLGAGATTVTQLDADNLRLDGNTLSSTDTDGNINLSPDGVGIVNVTKTIAALAAGFTGNVTVTGLLDVDNVRIDGNTISVQDTNGDLALTANGLGNITNASHLLPTSDNALDYGSPSARMRTLYLGTSISDGTNAIDTAGIVALRNNKFRDTGQTSPAQTGDSLFYDATSGTWLASVPDTEITHGSLGGLTTGDAGHTQFAMLSGRAGGQTVLGGTAASENLVLGSTAHGTKGSVLLQDTLAPQTTASYSGGWSGTDIGSSSLIWRNIYSTGEHIGLRLENILSTSLPSFSAQTPGRVYYATDNAKAYVDTGAAIKVLGVSKFISDTSWNGSETQKDVDVSSAITDARNAIWQLMDNANNFEVMGVAITMTSASNVRIIVTTPLPSGSYRLIGLE